MDPFTCDGCHAGDFADFDHFCDKLGVQTSELPRAFAAWLAGAIDWDGTYGPVCEHGHQGAHWFKEPHAPFFRVHWCRPLESE